MKVEGKLVFSKYDTHKFQNRGVACRIKGSWTRRWRGTAYFQIKARNRMVSDEKEQDIVGAGRWEVNTGRYIPISGGSRSRLAIPDDPDYRRYQGFIGFDQHLIPAIHMMSDLYSFLGGKALDITGPRSVSTISTLGQSVEQNGSRVMEKFKNDELVNELMEDLLKEIVEKNVFVQAVDEDNNRKLFEELFDNRIPYDDFYNPRDEKTAYRISTKAHKYLLERSVKLEVVEVRNIGDLPLEERNRIKKYHKSQMEKRQQKVLDRLRAEYGSIG